MATRCLPAEWSPQGAVLLIWPHADTDWAADLARAERAFVALATAITRFEWLVLVCRDEGVRERALNQLTAAGCNRAAIATVIAATDDTWARDIAPLPVLADGLPMLVDCRFNGWGGKYPHSRDAAFGQALIDSPGFATLGYEGSGLTLEGGALETDGAGTALVNRPTLLDPQRNPDLDQAGAEAALQRLFGIERTHWLDVPALPGDHTDGHIDTLARFCGPATIAHAAPPAGDAVQSRTYDELARQLQTLRRADGAPFELIPLPGPAEVTASDGAPLPATYANFVVLNDAVLVPAYADAADGLATERLQAAFPKRAVVPVPARTFVEQGGSLHCLTLALPADALEDLVLS